VRTKTFPFYDAMKDATSHGARIEAQEGHEKKGRGGGKRKKNGFSFCFRDFTNACRNTVLLGLEKEGEEREEKKKKKATLYGSTRPSPCQSEISSRLWARSKWDRHGNKEREGGKKMKSIHDPLFLPVFEVR